MCTVCQVIACTVSDSAVTAFAVKSNGQLAVEGTNIFLNQGSGYYTTAGAKLTLCQCSSSYDWHGCKAHAAALFVIGCTICKAYSDMAVIEGGAKGVLDGCNFDRSFK